MKLPVDDATLSAWTTLLGLTEEETTDTVNKIEQTLRRGYVHRPLAIRHLSFEELTADMDVNEFALLFLITGLRCAGYPEAAQSVEERGIAAQLQADSTG
ncbi:hypothetical protein [Streptomyces bluensis]|uniref:hypothetical protein n=1 Tax=Streptomyces bluensis TaxID=33897 RepID=UPI00332310CC